MNGFSLKLIQETIALRNNSQLDKTYRTTRRAVNTTIIIKKEVAVNDRGFKSKGMACCCMLKMAAASAIG
jgi:hypothetical protein